MGSRSRSPADRKKRSPSKDHNKHDKTRSRSRMYRPEWNAERGPPYPPSLLSPTPSYSSPEDKSYYSPRQQQNNYRSPPEYNYQGGREYRQPQRQEYQNQGYQRFQRDENRDCNADYRLNRNQKFNRPNFKDRRHFSSRSRSRSRSRTRSPPRARRRTPPPANNFRSRSPPRAGNYENSNLSKWDVRKKNFNAARLPNRPDDNRAPPPPHKKNWNSYSNNEGAKRRFGSGEQPYSKRAKWDDRDDSLIREQVKTQKRLADRLGEPVNRESNSNQFGRTNSDLSDEIPSTSATKNSRSVSREPARDNESYEDYNRSKRYSKDDTCDDKRAFNVSDNSSFTHNEQSNERMPNLAGRLGPEVNIKEEQRSFLDDNAVPAQAHQDERKNLCENTIPIKKFYQDRIKKEVIEPSAEDSIDSNHYLFGRKDHQNYEQGEKLNSSNCADYFREVSQEKQHPRSFDAFSCFKNKNDDKTDTTPRIDDRMSPRVVISNLNLQSKNVHKPGFENEIMHEEDSSNSADKLYQPSTSSQSDLVKSKSDQTQNISNKSMNQVTVNKKDILKIDQMLQLKSIMLLLQSKHECKNDISLISEVKKPEDLNDAIFCFKQNNSPTSCSLYSVKYIVSETRPDETPKIGLKTLASPCINIKEMFSNYQDLKEKITSQNCNIESFVLHTNLELDEQNFGNSNIEVIPSSRTNGYKLKVGEEKKLFRNLQESYATLVTLSKLIAEYTDGKDHYLCGLMEKYHKALIMERVIVETNKKEAKNKKFGKFHKDFIDDKGLSPSAKLLRSHLESILKKPITQDIELSIPQNFGDVFPVSPEPQLAKVEDLAKKLVTAAQLSLEEGKTAGIKNNPNIREDLHKIAEHVLKKVGKSLAFSDEFLDENFQLPGNLKGLRNLVFHTLKVRLDREDLKLTELKKCKFSIKKYNYVQSDQVKTKLPGLEDTTAVRDFFDKLEFVVDKSDVDEAIKRISPELADMDEKAAMVVQEDLLGWFSSNDSGSNPFAKIQSRQTQNMLFNQYEKPETSLEFKNETLNEFKSTLNLKQGRKMIKITTDNITWTKLKLLQSFRNTPQNSKNNHHLFINFKVFSKNNNMTQSVISTFNSPETNLLVIERDENDVDVNNVMNICGKLKKVINRASHKPNLIIMGELDKFPGIFRKDCEEVEDSVRGLRDLTDESARNQYENIEVALHGRKLKIKHLMTFETFQKIANPIAYFLELWESEYRVDVKSPVPVGFPKKCFIQRTLKKYNSEVEYDENSDERVIVITADSGCGKSSFVYWLHKKFGVDFRFPRWSVSINLTNVDFHKNKIQAFEDVTSAALFICNLKKYDELRRDLFVMSATGEINIKLVMFFDGFEELDPEYAEVVLNLLKVLGNSSVEKIFVTSSPNTKNFLETELATTSYYLECFSREEKIQFLQKYWSNELGMDEHDKGLHSYAEYFLKFYSAKEVDLTSTPQFIKMLAEINKKKLKFVPSKYEVVPIANFYELFLYTYEKILSPHLCDKKLLGLQKLSLMSLLNLSDFTALANEGKLKKGSNVEYVSHKTYAEFFGALYIRKTLFKCYEKMSYYVDKLIVNSSPVFFSCIYNLFDFHTREHFMEIARFLFESNYLNFLNSLLEHKNDDNNSLEIELFYLAIEKNNLVLVENLINRNKKPELDSIVQNGDFNDPIYVDSKLFKLVNSVANGKSALEIAASCGHFEIACKLLLHGCSLKNTKEDLLAKVILYVASEFSKDDSALKPKLHVIMEALFTSPVAETVMEDLKQRRQIFPILLHFFIDGPITVIDQFIDSDYRHPSNLENSIDHHQGMRLLKALHEGSITHELYRLKLLKYICRVTNQTDETLIQVILETALKKRHENIFKNFMMQYPGTYIGYLKWCMCTNNLDLIEGLFDFHNSFRCSGKSILHFAVTLDLKPRTLDFIIDKQHVNYQNNEKETPLGTAIKRGASLSIIKHLVKRGANPNTVDSTGMLTWCYVIIEEKSKYCKDDQIKIMDYFINGQECKIRAPLPKGVSSEPYDTWKEEVTKKLEYFRDPNYDINIDSSTGDPRLHTAIKSKSKVNQIWARFLITYGADVNIKNSEEKSALHLAIELKKFELAKTILRHGATFNEFDAAGKDTLKLLLEEGEGENGDKDRTLFINLLKKAKELFNKENFAKILKSLLADPNDKTNERLMRNILHCRNRIGYSLLHIAAFTNNESSINALLDFCVQCRRRYINFPALSVDVYDRQGNTPLHIAALKGFKNVIVTLLAKNACFELKNANGKTPLDLAINKGHSEIVELPEDVNSLFKTIKADDVDKVREYLIKIPSALNAKDHTGKTPMHHAATLKCRAVLEVLVSMKNPRINAMDFSMKTPLHYAIEEDNIESVKLLLTKNVMIDCRDNQNKRPFDFDHIKNESAEMVSFIYKLFEDVSSDNPQIFIDEDPNILLDYLTCLETRYNIEVKNFVNVRDHKRNNLMHHAVKYNYDESVYTLLKSGVFFDAPNEYNKKPIDLTKKHEKLFETLDELFEKTLKFEDLQKIKYDKSMLQNCRKYGLEQNLETYVVEKDLNDMMEWLLF